ncbi:MAG: ABC transporter ATP-binding protein [Melioribacteraceae bacterium]|nr:MAG: ABC transporter ATP-binding protein [Melioribacteraceae bacterium]
MSEIKLSSVYIRNSEKELFSDLSLSIPAGSFTLLRGGNGSGKFLLLKVIGGILQPDKGEVEVNGNEVYNYLASENTTSVPSAFIFQNGAMISNLNIGENLMLPLDFHFPQMPLTEKKKKIEYYMKLFGLKNILNVRPSNLEPDILKLAGIIRAFIVEPGLIIMHEPFEKLDDDQINIFEKLVEEEYKKGTSFILSSRINRKLSNMANYIVELYDHKIEWSGTIDEFRNNLILND